MQSGNKAEVHWKNNTAKRLMEHLTWKRINRRGEKNKQHKTRLWPKRSGSGIKWWNKTQTERVSKVSGGWGVIKWNRLHRANQAVRGAQVHHYMNEEVHKIRMRGKKVTRTGMCLKATRLTPAVADMFVVPTCCCFCVRTLFCFWLRRKIWRVWFPSPFSCGDGCLSVLQRRLCGLKKDKK